MSTLTICLLSTMLLQNPPAAQTGNNNQNNNNNKSGVFNPGTPPGPGRMPPDKDGGNRQPVPPVGSPNMPYQVMVDGAYVILAYDKFSQPLPGMAGIKVVIRNNILTFPGDAKTPGKMLQLTFGPANTVTVTPLDGTRPVNTNPNSPFVDNTNSRNGGVAQQGNNILPQPQGELGVYVLSNEYFAISIISNQVINNNQGTIPPGTSTGNNMPPGDPTRTATGTGTGGTAAGDAARNATGTGTTANDPARNATGGNTTSNGQTGNNNIINPRLPDPRQPDPRMPQPGPSQAVLVLKKVAQ